MRFPRFGVALTTALAVVVGSTAVAGRKPVRNDPRDPLSSRARRNPCELIGAILGPSNDGSRSCSKLRQSNGDLIVSLLLDDGDKTVRLLRSEQRCPGGFVAPCFCPAKARWVEFLEITLRKEEDSRYMFEGYTVAREFLPSGRIRGSGASGCGPEVAGSVRLSNTGWRLVGDRQEGCED